MMIEVSSPPEYASTTFSRMIAPHRIFCLLTTDPSTARQAALRSGFRQESLTLACAKHHRKLGTSDLPLTRLAGGLTPPCASTFSRMIAPCGRGAHAAAQ